MFYPDGWYNTSYVPTAGDGGESWSSGSSWSLCLVDDSNWASQSFQVGHTVNQGPFTLTKAEVLVKKTGTPGILQRVFRLKLILLKEFFQNIVWNILLTINFILY